jgi:CRP-like cAMP-binding protein
MEDELLKCLEKYVPITPELELALRESAFIKSFPRGSILLREGDYCNECYFVLKGCIRSFCIRDGEEITTEFYTEEQVVSPSVYGKKIPSDLFLECVEDTIASVGTPELEETMFGKYPQLESLSRVMGEVIMSRYQDSFAGFRMASPEQRYLNLVKQRPDLILRVPQHQIASYLGIAPESLSRIRKRTKNKA